MGSRKDTSKENLSVIIDECSSMREVLTKLGYAVSGASIKHVRRKIEEYGLTEPKYGSHSKARRELDDVLVENSTYLNSNSLKKRLIKEGLLKPLCSNDDCGISEWRGMPITLQLDHTNGIHNDNRIENLRLLCPNCHTQTETWGMKKRT